MIERKCIILCGGAGTRMLPLSLDMQKGMIPISGKPIIRHIVDYWRGLCQKFVFVVNYRKDDILNYAPEMGVDFEIIEVDTLRGIADGIYRVKDRVECRFIVVLGDCICKGGFDDENPDGLGVGVMHTNVREDIMKSYSVELDPVDTSRISRVVEKPVTLVNDLCGMGYYFFDPRIFPYIEQVMPSELRGEIEITDVIQKMIDSGEFVRANMFEGHYINITYPKDIDLAREFLDDSQGQDGSGR